MKCGPKRSPGDTLPTAHRPLSALDALEQLLKCAADLGLDGHQPPRSPAVRCCESPVAFPRGGAFLLGARPELCSGKWSVQKEATPRFQPCSDDTLPLSYVPHPPSPVRAGEVVPRPHARRCRLIYGEATVAPPRSPAGMRRISEDDGKKMPANSPIERLHVAPPHGGQHTNLAGR